MMQLTNLNFHLTFPPVADGISRLLSVADSEGAYTKEELSQQTGIPTGKSSGKVVPYINYAAYMGLLIFHAENHKYTLATTPLGRELRQQDPGLHEKVSLLVCHSRLTSQSTGASLWAYFFKSIFPRYPGGIVETLLKDELQKAAKQGAEVNKGPFLSAYTGMFAPLRLLDMSNGNLAVSSSTYDSDSLYAYAYGLLYEWETRFPERREITADDLYGLQMMSTYGLNRDAFADLIQRLADTGILHFNRQLVPYTVIQNRSSEDMIPLLYSLLC